ncbi:MAG: F0F1 ATP synthase subunit B [Gammaproteobacteria bacterium]|nr:MAG: F0F1 ATP synthase subunit B [Gammaproteobacteria bacterium]RLA47268.1 MAG: F0F1 ATP synthase subunit B [Gammaproteobacteria bacterium]
MELNSSTFILEIINFLILVWILKRFFYKPVLDVIARRKADIEETVAKAQTLQSDAENLEHQYESRLADWEQEKKVAQRKLADEIQQQREQQLAALESDLDVEREKEGVLIQRKLENERQQIVETALVQGAQFASHLVSNVAGPELEQGLVKLLLDELKKLPADQRDQLSAANGKKTGTSADKVTVTSAYPLDQTTRQTLERVCSESLSTHGPFHYQQDPALLAGLRINLGSWVLATNLQDELKGFTEIKQKSFAEFEQQGFTSFKHDR